MNKIKKKSITYQKKMIGNNFKKREEMLLMFYAIQNAFASKCQLSHEKQIILLIIPNKEKWHYITVKKITCIIIEE